MRRLVAALLVAVALTSCGADHTALRFGDPITVARATGVQAMALDGDTLYYGEFDTGDVYRVDVLMPSTPVKVGHVDVRAKGANGLQSLAVHDGRVYVSWVRDDRHLVVGPLDGPLTWIGPLVNSLRRDGHIAFDSQGRLFVSIGRRIYRLGDRVTTVSKGWRNPFAFTIDPNGRVVVVDQPRAGAGGTKASGVAFVGDTRLVCRSNVGDVAPLHGVKCRNAIVTTGDGSVITAIAHEIRRYPPA